MYNNISGDRDDKIRENPRAASALAKRRSEPYVKRKPGMHSHAFNSFLPALNSFMVCLHSSCLNLVQNLKMLYKRSLLIIFLFMFVIPKLTAQHKQLNLLFSFGNGLPAKNASIMLKPLAAASTANTLLTNAQGLVVLNTDNMRYTFHQHFTELTGVQITSRKKILEVRDDRFIYNVGADSSARSKSLSEILSTLPFVTIDGTGNMQIAGQTTYKVLLNGKETSLFVRSLAQALRSFPAEIVSRIELITSPGARYDAEGVTAIINIITKKFVGYKGFSYAYISDRSHYSNGITLTGRAGKMGVTVNGDAAGTWNSLKGYTTSVTQPIQTS